MDARPADTDQDAAALVRRFLDAMERRDLDAAAALTAPGFAMTFPGNARFERLADLVDWARPRYRFVRKRYDRVDVAPADDHTAVYCFGTLEGEWPDGTPFAGIRFIDRFAVRDGRLVDQLVWNDLAESRNR
jgi:ketosteroid isomerase-like protein